MVSGDSRNEELVLGHVNGYVTFWSVRQERPVLLKAVDVRSPSPLVLEPQIWHVRGVKFVAGDRVVTGSEDGDLCLLGFPDGRLRARCRFNDKARRGINDIAIEGSDLFVVSCAVGPEAPNLCGFKVSDDTISPRFEHILVQDQSRPNAFAFSVETRALDSRTEVIVSTIEGLIWPGRLVDGDVAFETPLKVASEGGAPCLSLRTPWLLSIGDQLNLYRLK